MYSLRGRSLDPSLRKRMENYEYKIRYRSEYLFKVFPRALGTAVAQWLRCCATNRKVAGSIPAGVSGFFINIKSFRSHCGPGVDSASDRNEYQEHFLGGKSGRCVRPTTLPPSCAIVTKSGNLNFLEPSGPVQACNGIDLPFTFPKGLGRGPYKLGPLKPNLR